MNEELFIAKLGVIIAIVIGIIGVLIFKLQLYKNTTSNLKKKHKICNLLIFILSFPLVFMIYITFFQDKMNVIVRDNAQIDDSHNEWEITYKQFIISYYNFIKNTNTTFNDNECKFAIYDIDKDGYPELFTYYYNLDSIYTYDSENDQMIKITGHIAPKSAQLYASKTKNELIISGWDSSLFRFSYTNFYLDNYILHQIIKNYSLVKCMLEYGDSNKYGYYYEDSIATYNLDEETYKNNLQELLFDKNEIIFYKIEEIGDNDLSIYTTIVQYDD